MAGILWIGVGSRIAMAIIAAKNEHATGLTSDDGFTIGQFTLENSLNLMVAGIGIGTLGGILYVALRGLRVGPGWFQLLSITLAPAVVGLSMLVHPDGVDFTVLQPPVLTIGLFAVIAWGYTLTVALLSEWFLAPGGLAERGPRWFLVLGVLPAIPLFPLVAAVAVGRALLPKLSPVAVPAAWVARAALFALFLVSATNLASDVQAIA
ncbi:MAG TPA: hypothetical protein VFK41_06580 [Nocardioidaceae bacterium]|nr:hypothetical protein [Nocardioidaceae bacterium]